MNQFFVFKKMSTIPRIFSELKFNFRNIDKTCIDYAAERYGKNVVFNIPLSMVNIAKLIRSVYPYDIYIGVIDDLDKIDNKHLSELENINYIVLYANSIEELVSARKILRELSRAKLPYKKYIILRIDENTLRDDILLFLHSSTIYSYRPVFLVHRNGLKGILGLVVNNDIRHCITKWFNHNVYMYFNSLVADTPVAILSPFDKPDVELVRFSDCFAFLCRSNRTIDVSSIIRYLYENSKPLIRIGDVIIDDEFVFITDKLGEYKSIRLTSKNVGVSYTRVRRVIKELEKLEKLLGIELIEMKRGGSDHGKTSYTHIGKVVIDNIKDLYGSLIRSYSNIVSSTLEELKSSSNTPICTFPLSL